jgi:hypothetical protein
MLRLLDMADTTSSKALAKLSDIRRAIDRCKTIVALRDAVRQYRCFRDNGFTGLLIENDADLAHVELSLNVLFEGESMEMTGSPAELNILWKKSILPRRELLRHLVADHHYSRLVRSSQNGSVPCYVDAIAEILAHQKQEEEEAAMIARSRRRMQSLRKQASLLKIKGFSKLDEETLESAIRSARQKRSQENRRLRDQERQRIQLLEQQRQRLKLQRLGLDADADPDLSLMLYEAGRRAIYECMENASGFVYFKAWAMPGDIRWYKIGITNDPGRRDAEQNVLPVPSETLGLIRTPSIEYARLIESAFRVVLEQSNIKGAGNRELFHLRPKQVVAIVAIMSKLQSIATLAGINK